MKRQYAIKLIIWLLFATFLLTISNFPAKAVVGVQSGDWVKYSVDVSWQSTITSIPEPSGLMNTEWVRYEVKNVVGNDVTANVTTHFKDETETSTILTGDIYTQTGDLAVMFVPGEIKQGDNISVWTAYMGSPTIFSINETVLRNYIGTTREVNHLNVSFSVDILDLQLVGYWDKPTGVACEITVTVSASYLGDFMFASISHTLTETNLWGLSPIWVKCWFWVAVVAVLVVIVVSLVFIRKRKMRPIDETETSENSQIIRPKDT